LTIKNKHATINLEIEKEKGGENKMQTYTIQVAIKYESSWLYSAVASWEQVEEEFEKIKKGQDIVVVDTVYVSQWENGEQVWTESYEKGEF